MSACGEPMRGIYGAETNCVRPRGHTGNHDPIWNYKDWGKSEPPVTPAGSPLDTLREALNIFEAAYFADSVAIDRFASEMENAVAALAAVEQLVEAARDTFLLAAVSYEGDPWYADYDELDGEVILAKMRTALARFAVDTPAAQEGGEAAETLRDALLALGRGAAEGETPEIRAWCSLTLDTLAIPPAAQEREA